MTVVWSVDHWAATTAATMAAALGWRWAELSADYWVATMAVE
jgi:hypothetical protein